MKGIFALADRRWLRIAGATLGLAIPSLWLWTLISPSEEVTRIRSALVFNMGQPTDFAWSPDKTPATFLLDKGPVAPTFQQAAQLVLKQTPAPHDDFAVAVTIAQYLMSAPTLTGGPIRSDLLTTFKEIKNEGRGYCADFTKVFNGIAIAAQIPVRQWGFAFDAFGSGHTFNEIYDRARNKWILVDSFHSLYFVDAQNREPLSAVEVHDRLLSLEGTREGIAIQRIVPARFPFRSDAIALDYYRRGMPQLYLVWGNNVFDYETTRTYKITSHISRSLEELSTISLGQYPRIYVYPNGVSERDVSELQLHRTRLLLAAFSWLIAAIFFLLQILGLFRRGAGG